MSDIDHEYTDEAVCPHCGHKLSDTWELFINGHHYADVDCDKCGEVFEVSEDLTVTYNTRKKAQP